MSRYADHAERCLAQSARRVRSDPPRRVRVTADEPTVAGPDGASGAV